MRRHLLAAVALLLPLTVAACDAGPGEDAAGPTAAAPSAEPGEPAAAVPSPTPRPTWPTHGCRSRSMGITDYAAGAKGAETLEEALAGVQPAGTTVVPAPDRPHRAPRWLFVDEQHQIVRAVGAFAGGRGWLIDTIEECAG